jgi:hypothetical protein
VSTFDIESLDVTEMPVGSLLPFKPDSVPEGWIKLKGQEVSGESNPLLYERIDAVEEIWQMLGGSIKDGTIIMPDPDPQQVSKMSFGVSFKNQPDMVLAIKAEHI